MSAPAAAAAAVSSTLRIALCQILCGTGDKAADTARALAAVAEAATVGRAQLITLPECWNSPYATSSFAAYAEPVPGGPTCAALSAAAREHGIFLVGGSIPERCAATGALYNTALAFGPDGALLARHRKMHLFDIDIPGRQVFRESDVLTAGPGAPGAPGAPPPLALFDTPWGAVGLGVCYDLRFPYLSLLLRQAGARLLVFPGAFNPTTGPAHWELLLRARALDAQAYVAGASPARAGGAGYQAYGHSTVVGPWGDVQATTSEGEATVYADLDMARLDSVRAQIPISRQARDDVYALRLVGAGGEAQAEAASTAAMRARACGERA